MGFTKLGFFFLLLFFHQLHLLLAYQRSNNTQLDTEFKQRQNASEKGNPQKFTSKEGVMVSVNRRGGGGGGHGGGAGGHGAGGHGNGGGHGEGGNDGQVGGGAVIPLYAAGAGGYHGRRHHGSNTASPGYCGLSYLVFSVFISIIFFVYFI
ncbi:glycine-rich cell wall structural protein-like [Pistacia vera]|uniref:glycine-rich cell wall structural protein-like n=1 Tax=Pistacia vera TaxID=55513 RepID=UPI001263949D|nr:glycine-rich cell wall structural protein-like [Pistacia vera]